MNSTLYWLPILAWSAISSALQGPGPGDVVELGSLKSRVPADWALETPDETQVYKQFRLEPVNDDEYSAQVTVTFVGKEKGSAATEYVKRWKGMFLPPLGKTIRGAAKVQQLTVNSAAVTYLDIRGDYRGIPGDAATPRQNFRLLGIYFETAAGPYTIRLFGPADTVEFYRNEFEAWVKAFK